MKKKLQERDQLMLFGSHRIENTDENSLDLREKSSTNPGLPSRMAISTYESDEIRFQQKAREILEIAKAEGLRVSGLVIHDNVHTLASIDKRRNLRLQEVFLNADSRVIRSLLRIIGRKKRKGDNERVNFYLSENPPHESIDGIPVNLLKDCYGPYGKHYDLQLILTRVMEKYTGCIDDIMITWRRATKGTSSITWGSYRSVGNGGIIRVNGLLDNSYVPDYVVESVVYHELLHHVIPPVTDGKSNRVHTQKFKEMLSRFQELEKSEKWKKTHFMRLARKESESKKRLK